MDMQSIISTIANVAGVNGAAVFADDGACVAHRLPPPYEPILIWEIVQEMRSATHCYEGAGFEDGVDSTLLVFEQGKLLTRTAANFQLVALTAADANVAVLGVAFNVASLRLQQPANAMPPAPSPRPTPTPGYGQSSHGSATYRSMSESSIMGASASGSSVRMSWSQTGGSQAPSGAVGVKVMRHVLNVAVRYFGRDARGLLEKELRRLNATPQTLTSAHFADVIKQLARRLDMENRDRFLAEVLGDRPSYS